jgi:hypothetical protein
LYIGPPGQQDATKKEHQMLRHSPPLTAPSGSPKWQRRLETCKTTIVSQRLPIVVLILTCGSGTMTLYEQVQLVVSEWTYWSWELHEADILLVWNSQMDSRFDTQYSGDCQLDDRFLQSFWRLSQFLHQSLLQCEVSASCSPPRIFRSYKPKFYKLSIFIQHVFRKLRSTKAEQENNASWCERRIPWDGDDVPGRRPQLSPKTTSTKSTFKPTPSLTKSKFKPHCQCPGLFHSRRIVIHYFAWSFVSIQNASLDSNSNSPFSPTYEIWKCRPPYNTCLTIVAGSRTKKINTNSKTTLKLIVQNLIRTFSSFHRNST